MSHPSFPRQPHGLTAAAGVRSIYAPPLLRPFIALPHQLSHVFPVTLGVLLPPLINPVLDRFLGAPGWGRTNNLRLRGTALFPLSYGRPSTDIAQLLEAHKPGTALRAGFHSAAMSGLSRSISFTTSGCSSIETSTFLVCSEILPLSSLTPAS